MAVTWVWCNSISCSVSCINETMSSSGTLLPRLPSEPGMTLLTIKIEKIGLKDAGQCIDPYITVSVKGTITRRKDWIKSSHTFDVRHVLFPWTCHSVVLPDSGLWFSVDLNGVDLNPVQDTPVATRKEDTYIHFSMDVEIQKHLEELSKGAHRFPSCPRC